MIIDFSEVLYETIQKVKDGKSIITSVTLKRYTDGKYVSHGTFIKNVLTTTDMSEKDDILRLSKEYKEVNLRLGSVRTFPCVGGFVAIYEQKKEGNFLCYDGFIEIDVMYVEEGKIKKE